MIGLFWGENFDFFRIGKSLNEIGKIDFLRVRLKVYLNSRVWQIKILWNCGLIIEIE